MPLAHEGHGHGGTTTRAWLTLLDAWSDADEIPHGRLLHDTCRASRALERSSAVTIAVSEPFLGRNGGKLFFWAVDKPSLAPRD